MKAKVAVLTVLVILVGCFGRVREDTVVLVEPGDVVEIIQEKKIKIRVTYTDSQGKKAEAYDERNLAGSVAMPKSVYRKMRFGYTALYDFVNGKIDEKELRARLVEERKARGSENDRK